MPIRCFQENSAGALPISDLFACLKARVAESLRNEKLMVADEKALVTVVT